MLSGGLPSSEGREALLFSHCHSVTCRLKSVACGWNSNLVWWVSPGLPLPSPTAEGLRSIMANFSLLLPSFTASSSPTSMGLAIPPPTLNPTNPLSLPSIPLLPLLAPQDFKRSSCSFSLCLCLSASGQNCQWGKQLQRTSQTIKKALKKSAGGPAARRMHAEGYGKEFRKRNYINVLIQENQLTSVILRTYLQWYKSLTNDFCPYGNKQTSQSESDAFT